MKKGIALLALALSFAGTLVAAPSIVVNASNSNAVDSDLISSMLMGKQKFWESGSEVAIAVLKDNPESEGLLKDVTGMDASRFKNHWQRLAFSGRGRMPKLFDDNAALLDFVKSNEGAIGIVDSSTDISTVKKVN